MTYKNFNTNLKQKLLERKALDRIRPAKKIQGVRPLDRFKGRGIIPIPQSVYAPAGGFNKIGKGRLHEGDTGLLKGDDE